jgi:beta-galactosidase
MSIKINQSHLMKNGKNHMVLSGEIHYFRLPKSSWSMHLDLAKSTGLNTICTYVPWIVHEELYRQYDFSNNFDLAYFLSLCLEKNLDVILKPGPYVMAEIKNEGLPYWIYEKFPEIIPSTWKNNKVTSPVVDYLHPHFLKEVYIWYKKLYEVIKPYTFESHGPVIGIQLDNEVGMLSWVTNQPTLTADTIDYLKLNLPDLKDVYAPQQNESIRYHQLLSTYMRQRFDQYIQTLKSYFYAFGLTHLIYFINIHGTSGGRGKTFPIGISQLINTYHHHEDILAGTDLYFGNIDIENFHDLYIVNSFVQATSLNKPYGSLELNVADGNFGDNLAIHLLPSSIDFKIRFAIFQNQKFLNYYLLTAGINPKLKHPRENDLNQRIAITGARHGFAAPIQVDGSLLYTYKKMKQTTLMLNQFSQDIASMSEQTHDIYACFTMDHYQSEYQMPGESNIQKRNDNLSLHRNSVYWDTLLKHMLLLHHNFSSIWIENTQNISKHVKLLMTNTSSYMAHETQQKFVTYLQNGGKMIFVGDLPIYDLNGLTDTTLIDYLNIKPLNQYFDWENPLLTLRSETKLYGQDEFRTFIAQSIQTNESQLFTHLITGEKIGIKSKQYVWITSNYPGHLIYTKNILKHLDIKPSLTIKHNLGYLLSFKQNNDKKSLYHLINLEHFKQKVKLLDNSFEPFEQHDIELNAQEAVMLWTHIRLNDELIVYSTGEIQSYTHHSYTLLTHHKTIYLKIKTSRHIVESEGYSYTKTDDIYHIKVKNQSFQTTIYFKS